MSLTAPVEDLLTQTRHQDALDLAPDAVALLRRACVGGNGHEHDGYGHGMDLSDGQCPAAR